MPVGGRSTTTSARGLVAGCLAALAFAVVASPAGALVDRAGTPVPATGPPHEQLVGQPAVVQVLADPETPQDDDQGALASLGSPADPEDDLVAALEDLAGAPDAAAADRARRLALDILEGNPVARRAYSGIPLLNWNPARKVATVPAGGNVTVREIRFGEHAISDTWALRFEDPTQPFTITYRIAELGWTGIGGVLAPTPLLAEGTSPIGGLNSVLEPLNVGLLPTGTLTASRFHQSAGEVSRTAMQDVPVRMPPPRDVVAILDPNLRPERMTVAMLAPATAQRTAAVHDAFGIEEGQAVSEAQKVAAIERIGDAAPEKQIWIDLRNLDPARATFLDEAHTVGRDDQVLAYAMQTRGAPPSGVPDTTTAQIKTVLLNGEPYVWTSGEPFVAGSTLTVAVTNADKYARSIAIMGLHHASPVGAPGPGRRAIDFGQFSWARQDLGQDATLAPGATRTFTVTPAPDTFAVAFGDFDHGDQGATLCRLDGEGGVISCPNAGVGSVRPPARPIRPLGETTGPAKGEAPGGLGPATRTACAAKAWIGVVNGARRVLLLGYRRDQVVACLGEPVRRARRGVTETWTYKRGLQVRFRRAYVYGWTLAGPALRSQSAHVGVGSRLAAVRGALTGRGRQMVWDRRIGAYRAVIRHNANVYADLKIRRTANRPYRVTRIGAAMRSLRQLDRRGRALAARSSR